jgi:multiple sugar transport system permease protein
MEGFRAVGARVKASGWKLFFTLVMGLITITMVMPFAWMVSTSFKIEGDVFTFPIQWIPRRWNPGNYYKATHTTFDFRLYYLNTIKVAILTTGLQVTISALAAYAFAKIHFRFSKQLFFLYLCTLMIPSQITVVPAFMVFRWLRVANSHFSIIVVSSFSVYGVFLLKQFMSTVPNELSESARIDGAGHFSIFSQIVMPIAMPAVATLGMLKFIWTWNDYQNPLIFLSSPKLYTLQLGMRSFSSEYGEQYALTMAAAVLVTIPLFVVFFIGQRYVIEGIAVGAVKG